MKVCNLNSPLKILNRCLVRVNLHGCLEIRFGRLFIRDFQLIRQVLISIQNLMDRGKSILWLTDRLLLLLIRLYLVLTKHIPPKEEGIVGLSAERLLTLRHINMLASGKLLLKHLLLFFVDLKLKFLIISQGSKLFLLHGYFNTCWVAPFGNHSSPLHFKNLLLLLGTHPPD